MAKKKEIKVETKTLEPIKVPPLGKGYYSTELLDMFDYLSDETSEKYVNYYLRDGKKIRCKPRTHEHPLELWYAALDYFDTRHAKGLPLTYGGLCIAIGYANRNSLDRAGKTVDFDKVLDVIKNIIQDYYEMGLSCGNGATVSGSRFTLSYRWGKADDNDSITTVELNTTDTN